MDHKRKILILIVGVAALSLAVYYSYIYFTNQINSTHLTVSGTIEATQVDLATKVAGRIAEFYKKEGEFVKKGDQICKLFSPELELALKQAKAGFSAADSQYLNTRAELERMESLYEQNLASQQQFDTASTLFIGAQARRDQAKDASELAEVQLSDTHISAPISGVLSKKIMELGELVFPGTTIYTLSDLSDIWLLVYIPEKYIGRIKYGGRSKIFVDSFPGKIFEGQIVFIASEAEFTPKNIQTKEERVKQVFGVKISIPNSDFSLKPGMPADAELEL